MDGEMNRPQYSILKNGELSFYLGRQTRFVRENEFSGLRARARAEFKNISRQSWRRVYSGNNDTSIIPVAQRVRFW